MMKQNPHNKTKRWIGLAALIGTCVMIYRHYLPPIKKTKDTPYEYGLVLGCAAHDDGSMSNSQLERCQFALKEYDRGRFKTLILSGSAVQNEYVEAEVMAKWIQEQNPNIPLLLETQAKNTWENLKFVQQMIKDAPIEIITGSMHARRASAIAANFFPNYCVASYPDFTFKKLILEARSRLLYCFIELKKSLQNTR